MCFLVAYMTVLVVFGMIDAIWITQMAEPLYKPMLGATMVEQIRIIPAVLFYLFYTFGIVFFAVMPALRDGSILTAIGTGALLGALCYATYDLTNYATLKNWTWQVTAIDIAYGAATAAICAAAAVFVVTSTIGK